MRKLSIVLCLILSCLTGAYSLSKEELIEIQRKENFSSEAYSFNRILSNVSLAKIFPNISSNLNTKINLITHSYSPEFNFTLIHDNSMIMILTSFNRPAKLTVNLNLNTWYLGYHIDKQVVVEYDVNNLPYDIRYIVEFEVKNTTIQQVLASEHALLKYLRTVLWQKETFFLRFANSNLELISIRPSNQKTNSFLFSFGSNIDPSALLWDFYEKSTLNRKNCSNIEWSQLDDFKQATGLELDLCTFNVREHLTSNVSTEKEDFVVNANFKVQISEPTSSWFDNFINSLIGRT